jgi:hypothetical protein
MLAYLIMNTLVKELAPVFRLHSKERYLPCSAEWMIDNSDLYEGDTKLDVSLETLVEEHEDTHGYSLRLKNESLKDGDIESAVLYCVVDESGQYLDIAYWLCFSFNGTGAWILPGYESHEADWEHVIMRLDKNSHQVLSIFLSAHGSSESKWYDVNDFVLEEGRYVIYVAKETHAFYPDAGHHYRHPLAPSVGAGRLKRAFFSVVNKGASLFMIDSTDGDGLTLRVDEDEILPLMDQYWAKYQGRWGGPGWKMLGLIPWQTQGSRGPLW